MYFSDKCTFLWEQQESYKVDNLTSVDEEIPYLINSHFSGRGLNCNKVLACCPWDLRPVVPFLNSTCYVAGTMVRKAGSGVRGWVHFLAPLDSTTLRPWEKLLNLSGP